MKHRLQEFAGTILILAALLFPGPGRLHAQCPQAAFTLPDTVCIGEAVNLVNTSTGAVRYEWDFCGGDFARVPHATSLVTVSEASIPTNITTVFDGSSWFAFFFSRENNTLFRLDFGNSLSNNPSVNKVGVFSAPVSRPEPLEFVQQNGNWHAFTSNFSFPSIVAASKLLRLDFGASLTNRPSMVDLGNPGNNLLVVRSIRMVLDRGNYICVVTNTGNNTISVLNFGASVTNIPTTSDIASTPVFPGSNNRLISTSIIKECDQWYGITTSETNGKLYRLSFGKDLFSIPSIEELTEIGPLQSPTMSALAREEGYVCLVSSELGNLYVVDFKNSVAANTPSVKNLGDFGLLSNSYGFVLSRQSSETVALSLGYMTKQITRITFSNGCLASKSGSIEKTPLLVSYSEAGRHRIILHAYNAANDGQTATDSVFVRPALTADFTHTAPCLGQPVTFTAPAVPVGNRAVYYTWDFGGGAIATGRTAQHAFATAGTHPVSLSVQDVCGKTVTATQSVRVVRPATADFTFPAEACSGQALAFADVSGAAGDPVAAWAWDFGDGTTAQVANPLHAYAGAGSKTVSLTVTGQSGCQTTITKTIVLKAGANVAFGVQKPCLGSQTQFTDQSVLGDGTTLLGRTWDFGDNSPTESGATAVHTYAQAGTYLVRLAIANSVGCTVTRTESVTVRRVPKAGFTASLACSGESTQFTDASNATEGALSRWQWDFGDPASGSANTADVANPVHTFANAGTYKVKLTIATQYGCTDSLVRDITVREAPKAAFGFQANCTSREVVFTDQSLPPAAGSLVAWYWDFGDGTTPATDRSPRHTYVQAGTFTVSLTVTEAGRCTHTVRQAVAAGGLPITIRPDTAVCAGQTVLFSAQVNSPNDPVTAWQWDFGPAGTFATAQPAVTVPASASTLSVAVTVTTASGCRSTQRQVLPVRPSPAAQFVYQVAAAGPLTVQFTNRTMGAARYEWRFGDGDTATASDPSHTYRRAGVYEVTLTAIQANGCPAVSAQTLVLGTGSGITVFPNPYPAGRAELTLGFALPRQQATYLELSDVLGKRLWQVTVTNTRTGYNTLNLHSLMPGLDVLGKGVYMLTIRYEDRRESYRLLVQ